MIISVINHANSTITDDKLHEAIRAINRQITCDFEPYWHMGGALRLEGRSELKPGTKNLPDMRGDAILYVWSEADLDDALGYHDANHRGVPYGFVFTELAKAVGENWTVTLSHEALELIADPEVNLLVQGPHPGNRSKSVFHWYEMCDAVQDETYRIDDIEVSNFVLPLYFTSEQESGSRNDFLGHQHGTIGPLRSFGVNPGGYIGFYNPETGKHETVAMEGDERAAKRLEAKSRVKRGRRGLRYQQPVGDRIPRKAAPVKKGVKVLKRSGVDEAGMERRE
jgi:hypothetical protein